MILDRLELTPGELADRTGWEVKAEGLCRGERCVPFPAGAEGVTPDVIDVRTVAESLRMPLVADDGHGLWALGPDAGGHVLESAEVPPIVLADVDGTPFDLASLRGSKVLISAWASW